MATATTAPTRFSEILATTDFGEEADRALAFAKAIARGGDAELLLVHVTKPADIVAIPEGGWIDDTAILQREEERTEAAGIALREEGLRARALCRFGGVTEEIARECAVNHVDLVVTGTHGRMGFPRVFMGSHAEAMAGRLEVPVLIVGPRCAPLAHPDWKPASIICCAELTQDGAALAAYACRLAKEYGATLTIAHSRPTPHDYIDWLDFKRAIYRLLPSDYGSRPSIHPIAMDGLGPDALVEFAIADDAGLLVVPIRHRLLDFVPAKAKTLPYLMAEAPCPILTVRTETGKDN